MTEKNTAHSHEDVRRDVNALLAGRLRTQQARAAGLHKDYGFLWQSLASLHEAGGKRMRPYLFVLAYEALGGTDYTGVLPIGAALELLHTAMLIHDDVIDRDFMRRGSKNIAGMYKQRYEHLKKSNLDKEHFSNSAAILAGDLMLSDAYQIILTSNLPAGRQLGAIRLIGEAVYTVAGGELLDTEAVLYPAAKTNSLQVAELKTAYYSCTLPLVMGGLLAGAGKATQKNLTDVGTALGIAFQLNDDLMGTFGTSEQTGKATTGDLREGKRTYLLQQTLRLASSAQKKQLETIIGNPACNEAMALKAQKIMTACGARKEVELRIKKYTKQASRAVNALPISSTYKDTLKTFINQI